jgi:ABC-2 type transport system permease protein
MRNTLLIWRRELAASFLSPVAYVFMVVFLAMTGAVFLQLVEGHVGTYAQPPTLLFKVLIYFWLPVLVTIVTMRLFAEEKRSGTIEALLTAPVTEAQIVIGKYAGALTFLVIATAPAIAHLYILGAMSPGITVLDTGAVVAGGLFVFTLAAFCTAIGLVISLTTRNQIVAAICCFSGVLLPLLAGFLVSLFPHASVDMVRYVTLHEHLLAFARGSIDTRPLVLYVSGAVLLVFVSIRILEARRWK